MAQLVVSLRTADGNMSRGEFNYNDTGLVDLWVYNGGVPVDPVAVPHMDWRDPTGTVSTGNAFTKVATGHYQITFSTMNPGGTWKGTVYTGSPPARTDVTWTVREKVVG